MSSGKKKLILLFFVILLLAVPVTVTLVMQQQETRSQAAPATTLSFEPVNAGKTVGDTFTVNIEVNTGSNSISGAELHIQYDQSKLTAVSIDTPATGGFLPVVLVDGTTGGGFAFITLGSQPSQPKKGAGTLAVITFKATASTAGAPTLIKFTTDTRVAGTGEVGNVLASQPAPATITVNPATTPVPSASPTLPAGATRTPTPITGSGGGVGGSGATPTPTKVATGSGTLTPTRTTTPTATATPTRAATQTGTASGGLSELPVTGEVTPGVAISIGGAFLFITGLLALFVL